MLFKGSSLRHLAAKLRRAMRWLSKDAIYAVQFVVFLFFFTPLLSDSDEKYGKDTVSIPDPVF